MTLAAIDRLVHHATILEMNVESYRRRAALDRKSHFRFSSGVRTHATVVAMMTIATAIHRRRNRSGVGPFPVRLKRFFSSKARAGVTPSDKRL
jgi:hypothetical protein